MEFFDMGLINALLALSVLAIILPLICTGIVALLRKRKSRFIKNLNRRHTVGTTLIISGLLLVSIAFIRYAVDYYMNFYDVVNGTVVKNSNPELNWFELIPNSVLNALQTFSMDAEYEIYISNGKAMIENIGAHWLWKVVYGSYVSVLSGFAPVVGGAIIFDIIAGIFPSLRLRIINCFSRKKRYYFSELNERALSLATDIYDKTDERIVVVFSDTENAEENLIQRAKRIGAVCVKNEVINSVGKRAKNRVVFLIGECENENLELLTSLLEKDDKSMCNTEIYVFADDKNLSNIDDEVAYVVKQRLDKNKDKDGAKLPVIVPVDGVRNIAQNLLRDLPLYEPVVGTEKDKVVVTIFGSGVIGTQLFLSTYWCGQMLGKQLYINVVSKEAEYDFKGRIDNINPDILRTSNQKSSLLNYDDKHKNPVYFTGLYKQADVLTQDFTKILFDETKSGDRLIDSDYFIVALGSDEDDFAVADKLRQIVGEHHIYNDLQSNTVISYVVYNSGLCKAHNMKPKHNLRCADKTDVFMWAFGCMDDVYSVRNIFFSEIQENAEGIGEMYDTNTNNRNRYAEQREKAEGIKVKQKVKRFTDVYNHKANLARSIHLKYKVFSAGYVKNSVFSTRNRDEYVKMVEDAYSEYARFAKYGVKENDITQLHKLAWLEHRRWNAFMRVCGFRCPEGDFRQYENVTEDHKNLALKLHPCLVESNDKGINSTFDDRGVIIKESAFRNDFENEDFLDKVSVAKKAQADLIAKPKKEVNGFVCYPAAVLCDDFKYWDYPMYSVEKDKAEFEHKAPEKNFKLFAALETESAKLEMSLYWIDNKWYMSKEKYYELVFQALENAATAKAGDKEKVDVNKLCGTLIQNLTASQNLKRGVDMIEFDEIDRLYESVLNRIDDFIVK